MLLYSAQNGQMSMVSRSISVVEIHADGFSISWGESKQSAAVVLADVQMVPEARRVKCRDMT